MTKENVAEWHLQPGISSMGKLLALSLVCTLTSAALFSQDLWASHAVKTAKRQAESKRSPTTNDYSQTIITGTLF
jgi:hypothetical protein